MNTMKKLVKKAVGMTVIIFSMILLTSSNSNTQDEIKLIIRGDDMGMTQGSL